MKNRYISALVTSCLSILPIVLIIYILSLTGVAPIGDTFTKAVGNTDNYVALAIGAGILIVGLSLFQIGASKGLTKVGEYMGSSLSRQTNVAIVVIFSFLLGALITCAEPSILIVSKQVNISAYVLIAVIAVGVGLFVAIGVIRIIVQKSLKIWYLTFYFLVFLMICLLQVNPDNHQFLPFIFDSGGITTGSATVPFILALGAGVATVRGGKNSRDSSFGLVGMASIGPILTMTIMILVKPATFSPYQLPVFDPSIWNRLKQALLPGSSIQELGTLIEVSMALLPIIFIFIVYELIFIRLSAKKLGQLFIGFVISYIGLVLFLTGTKAAMEPIGMSLGKSLADQKDWVVILIAFALGLVTILCEPAVHVLTVQIENISDGQLKKRTVLLALSIGVGIAICLAVVRTIFSITTPGGVSIMYIIVPGYLISLILMFVVPDMFTAIAFDSGGTASGPMAVSFILPMIIGLYSARCEATSGFTPNYYQDVFGCVALIALTPIIAIQILGVVTKTKNYRALRVMRKQIYDIRNDEIIHFN